MFKETSHAMILGKEKEEVEEYIKSKIGGNDLKVYKKEIEELKSEIKNKKELEKIEEKFTKDKDEYLFLINLLNLKICFLKKVII